LSDGSVSGGVSFNLDSLGFDETFEYDSGVWKSGSNSFEDYFNLGNDGEWFIINSKALKFGGADGATIRVQLDKIPVELSENYENPLTGSDTNKYIYKGRITDTLQYNESENKFIVGKITVNYKNARGVNKIYDKYRFIMSPIENWK
jgi:hypothetical protein